MSLHFRNDRRSAIGEDGKRFFDERQRSVIERDIYDRTSYGDYPALGFFNRTRVLHSIRQGMVFGGGDRRASVQFDSLIQTAFPANERGRTMRPKTCRVIEVHVRGPQKERRVLESTLSSEGWEPLIFVNR